MGRCVLPAVVSLAIAACSSARRPELRAGSGPAAPPEAGVAAAPSPPLGADAAEAAAGQAGPSPAGVGGDAAGPEEETLPAPLVAAEIVFDMGARWDWRRPETDPGPAWFEAVGTDRPAADGWTAGEAPFRGHPEEEAGRRNERRGGWWDAEGTEIEYPVEGFPAPDAEGAAGAGPVVWQFARDFDVPDPGSVVAAFAEVRFAGGFVAWLDGREWFRSNVAPDRGGFLQPADVTPGPEWVRQTRDGAWQRAFTGLPAGVLRESGNVLAVQVQRTAEGGDHALWFDMRLAVHRRLGLVKAPWLQDLRPDGVTVRWETSALSVGSVRVGEAESADRAAGGGERCATLHEAVVSGLAPGTEHSYAVDWAACPGVADAARTPGRTWGSFRTAPEEGAPVAFVVYGDSRGNPAAHARVVAALLPAAREAGASFVVNTGDLTDRGDDYVDWQEQFFAPARPLLETLAFYPALGNHDHNHESWYDWFALPGNESWFSFRAGVAELFVLNAYGRLAGRSEQVAWLEEALAASVAPWRIVVVHQPTRSCMTGRDRRRAAAGLREVLEPILVRGGVRLVFAGHDHLYGRSREIDGLTVVTTGGGGAPPYRAGEAEDHEACSSVRHFCLVEVGADEVRVRAIDDEGSTIDDFAIRRTAGDGGAAD